MKKIFLVLFLVMSIGVCFSQETTQCPTDPYTRIGKLPNGLTYYIRHNEKPENQACFYIAQQVGSMQEEDNQRGLAHFLEHMAFNGTENFPKKRIIDMLQENGVNFGGELNAYTSFDETVYNIDKVPTNKNSWLIDSCLIILSDWSHRLTLDNKEIDNERGVIHSEWRMRTGANYRMLERSLPSLYPNSKYAHRMPIGIMDIVDNFPYKDLKDYYKTWYYPHHQGIIVVGDVDVVEIEEKIKKYFGNFETPDNAPKRQFYPVPDNDKPIFVAEKDKEQTRNLVYLMFKTDPVSFEQKNTLDYILIDIVTSLVSQMTDDRFNELMQNPDVPFVQAGADISNYLVSKTKDAFEFQAVAKDGKEAECLQTLMREALRIKKYGFLNTELQRAKAEYVSSMERLFSNRTKQDNKFYINRCLRNFLDNEPLLSIEQQYKYVQAFMPTITLQMVNAIAQKIITNDGKNLVALIMQAEKDGTSYINTTQMQQAINAAVAENITAYVDNTKNEPLVTDNISLGKIKNIITNSDGFDTEIWTLANGAKVVIKKTDFKDDEILFDAIRFGGSSIFDVDENNLANVKLCSNMVNNQGLGNFNLNELSKHLAGSQCNVSPYLQNTVQGFSGHTTPNDLETMLQMLYLYFTNVNTDENDYQAFVTQQKNSIKNRTANPQAVFSDSLINALFNNNIRKRSLTSADLEKLDKNTMFSMYKKLYENPASFTYFFVGNIDTEKLKPLVCKYIGNFKKNKEKNPTFVAGRQEFYQGKKDLIFTRKMETPQALIYDYLYTKSDFTAKNVVVAQSAAKVLGEMFFNEIREEKSIAYNAGAYSQFGHSEQLGKGDDIIIFACPVKPEHAQEAQEIMYRILKTVANDGFDVSLLDKAKEYFIKHYQETLKNNNYWLEVIKDWHIYNTDIHSQFVEVVNSTTEQDIKNYCQHLLNNYNHVNVMMLPE